MADKDTASDLFPWKATIVVGLGNVSHFFAMCSLFAYAGLMAVDLGWSKDAASAGLTAGWLASSVFVGRLFTAGLWGGFADKYGRRPALFATLASLTIGNLAFGFCTSFAAAIAARFVFLGMGNGFVTLLGILSCEVGGKARQTQVMAYVLGAGGFTQLMGPALGGYLYGTMPVFPALASSLVGTCIPLLTMVLAYHWLPETMQNSASAPEPGATSAGASAAEHRIVLPSTRTPGSAYSPVATATATDDTIDQSGDQDDPAVLSPIVQRSDDASAHGISSDSTAASGNRTIAPCEQQQQQQQQQHSAAKKPAPTNMVVHLLTLDPLLRQVTLLRAFAGFHFFALVELVPLWAIAPRSVGGLGFDQVDVGQLCGLSSIGGLIYMLTVMAPMIDRLGLRRSLSVGSLVSAAGFALVPFIRASWGTAGTLVATMTCFSFTSMGCQTSTNSVFALTNNVAQPETRGLVNGIAVTVEGVGKGLAPALIATFFALSLISYGNFVWGHGLVFWSLAASECSIAYAASCLPSSLDITRVRLGTDNVNPASGARGQLPANVIGAKAARVPEKSVEFAVRVAPVHQDGESEGRLLKRQDISELI